VQPILRSIEPPRHRKGVRHAIVQKYPHVGGAEDLGLRLELDAVAGDGRAAHLRSEIFEPVEVHQDLSAGGIGMDIWRGDVRRRDLRPYVVGDQRALVLQTRFEPRNLIRRGDRGLGQKTGLRKVQAARRINCPGPGRLIGVGEANVAALVVGKIKIVVAEPVQSGIRTIEGPWIFAPMLGWSSGKMIGWSSSRCMRTFTSSNLPDHDVLRCP
jgi:hypothetical protein